MALSGSFSNYPVTASYGNFGLYCTWSGEQSISGNYTNVTLKVYVRYYNLTASQQTNSTVSINGTKETYTSPAIDHYPATDTYKLIKTYTVKVPHNSDGTKSCTLSASWAFNGTYAGTYVGTITASKTVTLDTIARLSEPTVSASSATMKKTVTIYTNRKSTSLKHTLYYDFGSKKDVIIAESVTDSYTWTIPDLAAECNNALSGTCTIKCHTYSGDTYLGTKTVTLTLNVPGATTPTVSATTVKMGGSVTLGVSGRLSTNFKHVFQYSFGSKADVDIKSGVTSSCTWSVPDLAKECNNETSGTCTIKCHTYNGTKYVGTVSKTITLQVPDASVPTLSASTVVMGNSLTIYTNRKSSNFTHVIAYEFNGKKGTPSSAATTSFKLDVTIEGFAGYIPSATSGTGTITCTTYNGTAKVGAKSVTFTATVPDNSTTKPTISGLTLTPNHSLASVFSDIYIQGLSKIKATYSANAPYSSVKSVTMTVKNSSGKSLSSVSGTTSGATSATINDSGSVTVTVTVTNARGQTNSSSKTISFYEYSKPELSIYGSGGKNSLLRCNEEGTVTESGLHLKIQAGRKWTPLNGKNYCDLKYRCKVFDGLPFADEAWITLLDGSDTENVFNGVATIDGNASSEKVELAAKSSYLVEIQVNDTVGNQAIFTKTILTCEVAFYLANGGKGASFGKYPEGSGLEVAWRASFFGDVHGHVLGLSGLPAIADGTDIDTVTAHGAYAIASNNSAKTMTNLPVQEAGTLRVFSSVGATNESGTWIYAIQEYIHYQGAIRYMRYLHTEDNAGEWYKTEWMLLPTEEYGTTDKTDSSGTTFTWSYRKWSDGTAECWARRSVDVDATTAWGSAMFYGTVSNVGLPFNFIEPPICHITVEKGTSTSSNAFFVASSGQATKTTAPSILLCRPTSASGINVNVLYHVHGRWK